MSLIGKGSSSLKKKDVMEQKGIALGFKKIRFAHKATAGDTGIDLTSLVQPTEMAANGFVNPTSAEIARAQINLFRNNLKLVSSLRGLLVDQLSYVVSSASQINFLDFTAEEDEIFTGWLDEAPTTSLQVVDGKTIIASGILAAGNTDFNIGTPIEINKNPAQQIGAVMVFADRGLQYRKAGNVVSGDGDYIEVPVAGGLGSLLRFTASGSDRFITVISNGVVAERPDGSMTAMIERVQGQIDQMVPTLAAVAGVPETTFQTAPNDIDLKQFGDTVIDQQNTLDDHENRIVALEADPTYVTWSSGIFTPVGSSVYLAVPSGNSFMLTPGDWHIIMSMQGSSVGPTAYTYQFQSLRGANGDNTGAVPVAISNATTIGGYGPSQDAPRPSDNNSLVLSHSVYLRVTAPTTIWHVPYITATTVANARVSVIGIARKIS